MDRAKLRRTFASGVLLVALPLPAGTPGSPLEAGR